MGRRFTTHAGVVAPPWPDGRGGGFMITAHLPRGAPAVRPTGLAAPELRCSSCTHVMVPSPLSSPVTLSRYSQIFCFLVFLSSLMMPMVPKKLATSAGGASVAGSAGVGRQA